MNKLFSTKIRWLLLCLLSPSFLVHAQSLTAVKGAVTAAKDGAPLVGVTVAVAGKSIGTQTDAQGRFQLQVPDRNATLVFTYIGYLTRQEPLNGRSEGISISLEEDERKLEEVVVVGYGQQKRKDLTGAVTSVSGAELNKLPVTRADQMLQGKLPGVQVMNNSGRPGGSVRVNIRGSNSINGSNDPLVVIDGIIGASFQDINPNDIASMDVLKDASATAIYGSRGANGVIMITTKRGKAGKTKVSYNTYTSWQQVANQLDLMNAGEYLQMRHALLDLYKSTADARAPALEAELSAIDPAVSTNWQDEVYQSGLQMSHELSLSGGSEKTRFMLSAGYMKQNGIIKKSDFTRASLRLNLDHEVSSRLRVGLNLYVVKSGEHRASENRAGGSEGGDIIQNATRFDPTLPVYDAEGGYNRMRNAGSQLENPVAQIYERERRYNTTRLVSSLFASYEVARDLRFRTSFSYDYEDNLNKFFTSGKLMEALNTGMAEAATSKYNHWIIENTLTYDRTLHDHHLTVLGGFTAEAEEGYSFDATGRKLTTEVLQYNDLSAASNALISSGHGRNTLASFLGRINYAFKDRYLLTLSGRADGASKFAKNNKWAFFPSAALAWRVSEEEFLRHSGWVNNLKLRVSYGESGSQAISRYQSLARITLGANAYSYGNTELVGASNNAMANPNLTWETTRQLDAGMDISILNNRISAAVDYYQKTTSNLLYSKPVAAYTGYGSIMSNIGKMQNRGWEFEINTRNLAGAFTWSTNINFSANRNKVLELGDLEEIYLNGSAGALGSGFSRTGVLRIGHEIGEFYGYVFDGIYQNAKEVADLPAPNAAPGTVKFRDVNNDGEITPDDRTVIGSAMPDFTYGFSNDFSYRNFDLGIFFQGAYGNDILNLNLFKLERAGNEENSLRKVLGYWHGEGTSNTVQALDQGTGDMSSRYIEDGSYLRLKNLMLGYTLPAAITTRWGIQQVRLYGSAQNLLTFTQYTGYDPEVNSRSDDASQQNRNLLWGYDLGSYPATRSFTVGLNVTF